MPDPVESPIDPETQKLIDAGDPFAALRRIVENPDPDRAAKAFFHLLGDSYWKKKALPATVSWGQSGIAFCLGAAARAGDAERASSLRLWAKKLAYNLSSFTWTGWNEAGITITPSDLAIGHSAARLNLTLAKELARPVPARAGAYWLMGAHDLARGELPAAASGFESARALYKEAGDIDGEWMATGYAGFARLRAREADGARVLEEALAALRQRGTDDAKEYIRQLEVAATVFPAPGAAS